MLKFDFEILQLCVTIDEVGRTGRCIVDGVMHLELLEPLYVYPLRTILTYSFDITAPEPLEFKIREHEEMWSFGDMIAALPVLGPAYAKRFRRAFARGFLAASWLSRVLLVCIHLCVNLRVAYHRGVTTRE